ncbi:SocA family protein [Patescibacteria group bacterium]|nr:SocA family protein [Patescibacteria group bacterium]
MSYNKKKFKNVVLYLAENGGIDVGKKKLAKLLYFIDFTLYELRKKSLTEMNYAKRDFGPMPEPKVFYSALNDLEESGDIKINKIQEDLLEKIIPKNSPKMEVFTEEEKNIIERVTQKYYLESGGALERIAQSEPPYKMVNYGDNIPYHLAFYRNTFGEMDLND